MRLRYLTLLYLALLCLTVLWLPACLAAPADPPSCGPETPTVTWDTFGEGFVTTHCQGCHASTAVDRQGAPVDRVFDSEADVLAQSERILDAISAEPARMPPAGGLGADDRERLAIWLTCFTEQP
jgi:mono/diheme cytochrome c family protein